MNTSPKPVWDDGVCHVWWASPQDAHPALTGVMTPAERERADAYRRPIDRDRFIVGCALSRHILGSALEIGPADVPLLRECSDCGRPHGKPRLATRELEFSVSHAGDLVAVAVTPAGEVGVDVERVDVNAVSTIVAALGLPTATNTDAAFRAWVRLEAALKATGDGLRVEPGHVAFESVSGGTSTDVTISGRAPISMHLHDLPCDDRHRAALAVVSTTAVRVQNHVGSQLLKRNLNIILWTVH